MCLLFLISLKFISIEAHLLYNINLSKLKGFNKMIMIFIECRAMIIVLNTERWVIGCSCFWTICVFSILTFQIPFYLQLVNFQGNNMVYEYGYVVFEKNDPFKLHLNELSKQMFQWSHFFSDFVIDDDIWIRKTKRLKW